MTPRTVRATMIATTITTAWPLWERRSARALISVLRGHGGGRRQPQQVRRGGAEERDEAVVAVDHGDDDLEAALVAGAPVLRPAGAEVARRRVPAERGARGGAVGVRARRALLPRPDADLSGPGRGRRAAHRGRLRQGRSPAVSAQPRPDRP